MQIKTVKNKTKTPTDKAKAPSDKVKAPKDTMKPRTIVKGGTGESLKTDIFKFMCIYMEYAKKNEAYYNKFSQEVREAFTPKELYFIHTYGIPFSNLMEGFDKDEKFKQK